MQQCRTNSQHLIWSTTYFSLDTAPFKTSWPITCYFLFLMLFIISHAIVLQRNIDKKSNNTHAASWINIKPFSLDLPHGHWTTIGLQSAEVPKYTNVKKDIYARSKLFLCLTVNAISLFWSQSLFFLSLFLSIPFCLGNANT